MHGIVDAGFREEIKCTMIDIVGAIICHTLREWQTGVSKNQGDFKTETRRKLARTLTFVLPEKTDIKATI